jgi:hypothetical protein
MFCGSWRLRGRVDRVCYKEASPCAGILVADTHLQMILRKTLCYLRFARDTPPSKTGEVLAVDHTPALLKSTEPFL